MRDGFHIKKKKEPLKEAMRIGIDMEVPSRLDVIAGSISSPRYGWHCTTKKKMERYQSSGRIIAPVRFWPDRNTAERWAMHAGRELVIRIRLDHISYPLPDHKPAMFCPHDVVCFDC